MNIKTNLSHSDHNMLQDKIIILNLITNTSNSNKVFYGLSIVTFSVKNLASILEKIFKELLIKNIIYTSRYTDKLLLYSTAQYYVK
jgi:hypothetical protein